jgi:hypothetical protein
MTSWWYLISNLCRNYSISHFRTTIKLYQILTRELSVSFPVILPSWCDCSDWCNGCNPVSDATVATQYLMQRLQPSIWCSGCNPVCLPVVRHSRTSRTQYSEKNGQCWRVEFLQLCYFLHNHFPIRPNSMLIHLNFLNKPKRRGILGILAMWKYISLFRLVWYQACRLIHMLLKRAIWSIFKQSFSKNFDDVD